MDNNIVKLPWVKKAIDMGDLDPFAWDIIFVNLLKLTSKCATAVTALHGRFMDIHFSEQTFPAQNVSVGDLTLTLTLNLNLL